MLGYIWFSMILISVLTGVYNNTLDQVIAQLTLSSQRAFELALGLGGIMTLWLGFLKIAEDAGLVKDLSRMVTPVLRRIFPSIPKDHPAMGAIALNIAANMLGLSNAATPFGLKAMEELETLNKEPSVASNDMCMFLAVNTSSVQLIPSTAIGLLSVAGSQDPTIIVISALLATTISTIIGVFASFKLSRYF